MTDDPGWLAPVSYLPGGTPAVVRAQTAPGSGQVTGARPVERRTVVALDDPDGGAAYGAGVRALGRRSLSRRELERALRAQEFDDATVGAVADRLEREGALDDGALAQELIGRLQERKGLGRSAIAAELARRMIAPAALEYALDLVDTGDELARARSLAEKRARQLHGLDRETAARRLSGYLQRRGYSGSIVRAAVDQALPRPGARSG